jgi:dolichol-phosphate mannosyltransferase
VSEAEAPPTASGETTHTASIVLPTYNEAGSLPHTVPRIVEALREAEVDGEIIVVDDDSPDGTADVARELGKTYPVRVIHRTEERGLATAVLAGFAASRAQVCVVMDADGSHPVEALGPMIRPVRDDEVDITVGSRHVEGGGSKDWPLFARFKSGFAASLATLLSGLSDPTSGLMAIRRSLLESLTLDPIGWKIVLEVVVKAQGARVREVPIVFTDREHGESKQSLGVLWEYARHLGRLYAFRFPALAELVKFCLVGLVGLGVDLATVVVLKESFELDTRLCAVGGFAVAVSSNYAINRRWTFPGARHVPWWPSYPMYVTANLGGLGVRVLTVHLGIVWLHLDHGYGYLLTNFAGIVAGTLVNFAGAKLFAFDPGRVAFHVERKRQRG